MRISVIRIAPRGGFSFAILAQTRIELARPFLVKGFSYHTCFYTSNLNAFYYAIHFIGAGVSHLLFKILWSRLFHYHEKNLASWQYTLSSISKHYHLLMLSFYMYTTIFFFFFSYMCSTPFMKFYSSLVAYFLQDYENLQFKFYYLQFSSPSPKLMSP